MELGAEALPVGHSFVLAVAEGAEWSVRTALQPQLVACREGASVGLEYLLPSFVREAVVRGA